MSVVKNLMVRAGADFSGLRAGLTKAKQSVRDFSKSVNEKMNFKPKVDASGMDRGMNEAKKKAAKTARSLKQEFSDVFSPENIGLAAITYGAFAFLRDSSKEAMRLESAIASIDRTLGSSAQSFKDWAKNNALQFNLSQSDAMDFGRSYSNMVANFAKDSSETEQMTIDILKKSSVIASMTGRTISDVTDRILSGLRGETDAIEDLSIYVSQSMITSTDAFKRFANNRSWAQLSFQTQQQILYFAILEQATKKYGDQIANNTASQMAQFSASLRDTQAEMGKSVNVIINSWLPALAKGLQGFAKFQSGIFDLFYFLTTGREFNLSSATQQIDSMDESLQNTNQTMNDLAKDANKFLAPFDEINQVPAKVSQSFTGAPGTKLNNDGLKKQIEEQAKLLNQMKSDSSWGTSFGKKVKSFWDWLIPEPTADDQAKYQEYAKRIEKSIDDVIDFTGYFDITSFEPLTPEVIAKYKKNIDSLIQATKETGKSAVKQFQEVFENPEKTWDDMWNGIALVMGKSPILEAFGTSTGKILEKIKTTFEDAKTGIGPWFQNAWSRAISIFDPNSDFLKSVTKKTENFFGAIKAAFAGAGEWFKTNVTEPIGAELGKIKDAFGKNIGEGLKAVLNVFINMFNTSIKAFNKFKSKIPLVNKAPDIPQLTPLATGGIVTSPTMALIGEAGPEMVVPLENTSFVDRLAGALGTAVMSAMQISTQGGRQSGGDVVIKIDGNTIARAINPYLTKESNRIGSSIISIS